VATVAEVADLLATQLSDATGLRATDYVPESISPPAAFVRVNSVRESTFGYGSITILLDLIVLVSRSSARVGAGTLYDLMNPTGPMSVPAAVMSLGETDISIESCEYRSLGIEEVAAYQYDGGAFETVVETSTGNQ